MKDNQSCSKRDKKRQYYTFWGTTTYIEWQVRQHGVYIYC